MEKGARRPSFEEAHGFMSPAFFDNPYPYYRQLREHDPIYWSEKSQAWLVTDYQTVSSGLRDKRLSVKRVKSNLENLSPETQEELAPLASFYSEWLMYVVNPQFEMDLKPQQYVVVYSDPELIKQRRIARNESGGRQSEVEDEETIDLHQCLAISTSRTLADYHGAGLTVIYNGITNVDENVELLKDRISALA